MKVVAANLVISVLIGALASEKIFFPGNRPKLNEGFLNIKGYYIDGGRSPLVVPDDAVEEKSITEVDYYNQNAGTESRFLLPKIPSPVSTNPIANSPFASLFSLFRFPDIATVTNVVPPLCVACRCLQTAQTCLAAGGVQLTTQTMTLPAIAAGGLPAGIVFGGPGATGCQATTPAGPLVLPNAAAIAAGTVVTVTCVVTPSAELSVCDPACKTNTGAGNTCNAAPSTANCPQFPTPDVCRTNCRNLAVGDRVRCNNAFPTIISPRPTQTCMNFRKRDTTSADVPELESSIQSLFPPRTGKAIDFRVSKTTLTTTITSTGSVTATYVPNANCLPSNVIQAPDC